MYKRTAGDQRAESFRPVEPVFVLYSAWRVVVACRTGKHGRARIGAGSRANTTPKNCCRNAQQVIGPRHLPCHYRFQGVLITVRSKHAYYPSNWRSVAKLACRTMQSRTVTHVIDYPSSELYSKKWGFRFGDSFSCLRGKDCHLVRALDAIFGRYSTRLISSFWPSVGLANRTGRRL